jgi:LmbE family N-acetylglucosaminyl deacetylase
MALLHLHDTRRERLYRAVAFFFYNYIRINVTWIYLSPHFDDAVYSCGGLIWRQAHAAQRVEIWTVCAGEIPPGSLTPFAQELHARWSAGPGPVAARSAEDEAACRILGVRHRHFSLPDCIYRRLPDPAGGPGAPVITRNDDLWLPFSPGEAPLVEQIATWIRQGLPSGGWTYLVSPLTVGGHVDHRLVRAACEALGLPLCYYADYPYSAKESFSVDRWLTHGRPGYSRRISPAALAAWQQAAAAYASQLSSFWGDVDEMHRAIADYSLQPAGHSLWR